MLTDWLMANVWKGGTLLMGGAAAVLGVMLINSNDQLADERVAAAKADKRATEVSEKCSQRMTEIAEQTARAVGQAASEQALTISNQLVIANEQLATLKTRAADASRAAATSGRVLSDQRAEFLNALASERTACAEGAAAKAPAISASAIAAADLFTGVLERMDRDARAIAAFADESSVRGVECQRFTDELTARQ